VYSYHFTVFMIELGAVSLQLFLKYMTNLRTLGLSHNSHLRGPFSLSFLSFLYNLTVLSSNLYKFHLFWKITRWWAWRRAQGCSRWSSTLAPRSRATASAALAAPLFA